MNKLVRTGGYLGGVCEGLGIWSGLPPILFRIGFLFVFPYAFILYILLCIFVKRKEYIK
jgi:phage shock protein PspC (stress-responsive transcriptional regulator)